MTILSAFIVALSLSMDNFAVTLASGCAARGSVYLRRVVLIGISFAIAHIIMFSAGWFFANEVGPWVDRFDHWIAFFVLAFIGGKMIKESARAKTEPDLCRALSAKMLLALAVATSLDALFVGGALSLEEAPFWLTLWFMAACVLATSCAGFYLGGWLGRRFGSVMEALGGIALLGVGIKVLLNGLGIW